mgnify:FL=1
MIEECDAEELPRVGDPSRKDVVFRARRTIARWVVMNEDQTGGVQENGTFEDFPGVYEHSVERAHRHMIQSDGRMFRVEKERIKMFTILVCADVFEIAVDVFRRLTPRLGVERRGGLFDETDGVAGNLVVTRLVLGDCSFHGGSSLVVRRGVRMRAGISDARRSDDDVWRVAGGGYGALLGGCRQPRARAARRARGSGGVQGHHTEGQG